MEILTCIDKIKWGTVEYGFKCLVVWGPALVLFFRALHDCIWNAPAVSLVLPTFDATGHLGSTPHQVVYPPGSMVAPWVTASRFLTRNREAELKPTTFSYFLLLLFRIFLPFLFS